jgi:hypothetical protein
MLKFCVCRNLFKRHHRFCFHHGKTRGCVFPHVMYVLSVFMRVHLFCAISQVLSYRTASRLTLESYLGLIAASSSVSAQDTKMRANRHPRCRDSEPTNPHTTTEFFSLLVLNSKVNCAVLLVSPRPIIYGAFTE